MEHYKVILSEWERTALQDLAGKGTHAASKVINALILLNYDQAGGRIERPRYRQHRGHAVRESTQGGPDKKFVMEGLDQWPRIEQSLGGFDLEDALGAFE